jgi:hypothetical protein
MANKPLGKTTIQIPANINEPTNLKRFLLELINYIDLTTGVKDGDTGVTISYVENTIYPWVTDTALLGYATQSWVTGTALTGYATQS